MGDDEAIEAVIAKVLAVIDNESTRKLCTDLYILREEYDTATAVRYGEDLVESVQRFKDYLTTHRGLLRPLETAHAQQPTLSVLRVFQAD